MTSEKLKKDMGSKLFIFHGFVELFLNRKWVEAICAFDKELCIGKGYSWVDFDGMKDGLFASTIKDGKPFVEHIKNRGFIMMLHINRLCKLGLKSIQTAIVLKGN